jgi:hypothetical protein
MGEAMRNEITVPPDLVGKTGRAWRVDVAETMKRRGLESGDVACWIVEAPNAHPVWHSYWFEMVHLRPFRDMEGDTHIYLEGATHEMWIAAIDPDKSRQEMLDTGMIPALRPLNFACQFIFDNDHTASLSLLQDVRDVIDGVISPDTDFVRMWVARHNGSMIK